MELAVNKIKVGSRHRSELGDIDALAESIKRIGLLHPIVVLPDGTLVVGARRLSAYKKLGHDSIPANVATSLSDARLLIEAERDENTCRKDFLPEEFVALGRTFKAIEAKAAKERHAEGVASGGKTAGRGRPKNSSGENFPIAKRDESKRTRSMVSAAAGISDRTYEKAEAVVAAAEAEPEKFRPLVDEMNRTGKVNGAFKKLKVAKQVEAIAAEPPPLPTGPFRVIVVDPPWKYDAREQDSTHRASNPYPSLSIDEITRYRDRNGKSISDIAAEDCVLWLWTTNSHIMHSFSIAEAWGFTYKTMLTWAKDRMGTGDWLRGKTEHCLMCIRGKPVVNLTNQTTLINGPLRKHSQKPDEFYEMVESLCPGSKAEVFSRTNRDGWHAYGDEAGTI